MTYANVMMTLICKMSTTFCAGCPEDVTITLPALTPYRAGDVLTCSSDGYPAPTYTWEVGTSSGSITNMQELEEGEHEYECTATVTFADGTTCQETAEVTVTAYSKYKNVVILL